MAIPDSRQMNRMRQDAIRRSQEMHRRSTGNYNHYSQGSSMGDIPPLPDNAPLHADPSLQRGNPANPLNGIIEDILGSPLDSDKLLIAAILLLLVREGGDIRLILALGYILL